MEYKKKIAQLFFVISLLLFSSSCKDRCYSAEEFSSFDIEVDSRPTNDGITGTYDSVSGGQTAEWHNSGLVSNGEQFVITISGAWVPWQNGGTSYNSTTLTSLSRCDFCAKRQWNSAPNCVCYNDQSPKAELGKTCGSSDIDNPNLCTCTNKAEYGSVYDYGFYHIPLNYYEKNETAKIADLQESCKFDQGMGLYIGLFGSKGVTTPKRQYHLFSKETVCSIRKNSDNKCVDKDGVDRTRYVYRSPNERIFMKDDNNGNDGQDTNTDDDVYHGANEVVKFIIADDYYGDNYGKYNISILKGVGYLTDKEDRGILEFLVRLVEDVLLGKLDENNERKGGIVEFMYKSIVQDTIFILTLRTMLALYIAFYGIATLFGVAEINKKELLNRTMKIGLILFFTSPNSWKFYNEIVVGFFYDSMNYLISLFTSLSNEVSGITNTPQSIQAESHGGKIISNASRFGYIDSVISMLLSESSAAKIFGLIFSDILGVLYVAIIYIVLILPFVLVMLHAACTYAINMMKIIFVLSIGPIFICFTLFSQTAQYFKNWIGYLGARSLEMVIMFFVLYTFVMLLNTNFNNLLYYEACVESFSIADFTVIKILRSDVNRSVIEWFSQFFSIAALIFITKLILDKIPSIAGQLISIGGVANRSAATDANFGQSSADIAKNMLFGSGAKDSIGGIVGIAKKGLSAMSNPATQAASGAASGVMMAARASGISAAIGKYTDMIPLSNPRAMYRNSIIDAEIKAAKKQASAQGLDAKATDAFIRKSVNDALHKKSLPESFAKIAGFDSDRKTMAIAGIDSDSIQKRLDQKLIEQPLQKVLKEEAARIKASDNPLFGKDLKDALTSFGNKWASDKLSVGADDVKKYLSEKPDSNKSAFERKLSNALDSASKYSSSEAAKAFANKPELKSKYMESLAQSQTKIDQRRDQARKGINTKVAREINGISSLGSAAGDAIRKTAGIVPAAGNMVLDKMRSLTRSESANPTLAAKNFARESQNIAQNKFKEDAQSISEIAQGELQKINPLNNSSTLKDGAESAANSLRWAGNKIANLTRNKDSQKEFTASALTKNIAKDHLNQGFRDYLRSPAIPRKDNKDLSTKDNRNLSKRAAEKEASQRAFAQRKLREFATKDRDLNKEIKSIKALEARGKEEEAKNAKIDLMNRLTNDLIDVNSSGAKFKKDSVTVFERLTRLDHVQNQLNIKEFSSQTFVSDLLKEKFDDRAKEIAQISKDKNYLFNSNSFDKLQSAIGEARQLNNGLFFDDHLDEGLKGNKALNEIAEKLSNKIRNSISGIENKDLEGLTNFERLKLSAESLTAPAISSKDFENDIKQDQKTAEESAQIKDKLKDLEEMAQKVQKEKEEKDAADKIKKDAEDAKKKAEEAELKEAIDLQKAKEEAELKAKEREELKEKNKKESELRALEADEEKSKLFGNKNSALDQDGRDNDKSEFRKDLEKLLTPEEQIDFVKEKANQIFEALSQPDALKGIEEKELALGNLALKLDVILSEFEEKKLNGTLTKEDEEKIAYICMNLAKDLEDLAFVKNPSVVEELQGGAKDRNDEFAQKADSVANQLDVPKSEVTPLIPTSFEVQFGSSISDILLKEIDLGLKAGNPFLGVPDSDPKQQDAALKKALDMDIKQTEMKQKIKEMELKTKQYELELAKGRKVSEDEKKTHERLIESLESEVSLIKGKLTNINSEVDYLKKSSEGLNS